MTNTPATDPSSAAPPLAGATDVVEIILPADNSYVSVVRTLTASVASKVGFTIDDIEDLRIVVNEACALIGPQAVAPDGQPPALTCRFVRHSNGMEITVSASNPCPVLPDRSSFGWMVLSTLAGHADAGCDQQRLWIHFSKTLDENLRSVE